MALPATATMLDGPAEKALETPADALRSASRGGRVPAGSERPPGGALEVRYHGLQLLQDFLSHSERNGVDQEVFPERQRLRWCLVERGEVKEVASQRFPPP